jgi:hypothetical protein
MGLLRSIISLIITTFMIAAIYGLFCTTVDLFSKSNYDPVMSGRRAAGSIYGLFGVVTEEVNRNDANEPPHFKESIAQKIAAPYAVTADVVALLGGKLERGVVGLFDHAEEHTGRPAGP